MFQKSPQNWFTASKGTCFFSSTVDNINWLATFGTFFFAATFISILKNFFWKMFQAKTDLFNMQRQPKTTHFLEANYELVFILTNVGKNFLVATLISGEYSVLATFMGFFSKQMFQKSQVAKENCFFFFSQLTWILWSTMEHFCLL